MTRGHAKGRAGVILAALGLLFLGAGVAGVAAAATSGSAAPARLTIALQPLDQVDPEAIALVRSALEEAYRAGIVVLDPAPHPTSAWYAPRKRWRAGAILDWLRPRLPDGVDRIVALTASDISVPKPPHTDWGICGYGDISGPAAVVSTWRVGRKLGEGTRAERAERYRRRLRGLAAHEVGHTLGLHHCPRRGCTMEDARGSVKTFDHWTGRLCDDCRERLGRE